MPSALRRGSCRPLPGGRVPGPPVPTECHLGLSAQSGPQFPGLQPGSKWGVTQTVRVLKAAFLKPSQRLVAAWCAQIARVWETFG